MIGRSFARTSPLIANQIFGFLGASLSALRGSVAAGWPNTSEDEIVPIVMLLVVPEISTAPAPYHEFGASVVSQPGTPRRVYIVKREPPSPSRKFSDSVA